MKFSIITPTHKRAEMLIRAVTSVKNQTYTDWEMIIVNDSPTDSSYTSFTETINDARIRYHLNKKIVVLITQEIKHWTCFLQIPNGLYS